MTNKYYGIITQVFIGSAFNVDPDEPVKLYNTREERDLVFDKLDQFGPDYVYTKFEVDRP